MKDQLALMPTPIESKRLEPIETKDIQYGISMDTIFGNTDNELGSWLSATMAYYLFAAVDCVHNAITIVSDEFSQIRPVLQDKKTKEYVLEHEALSLIESNDMRWNESQVKKELMISFMAGGEAFPVIGGNVNYDPVSFRHYPANTVSVMQGSDGYIQTIIGSYQNVITTYNRAIDTMAYKNGLNTYLFEDQIQLNQMMHIISNRRRNYLRAQSDLESVYYQALMKFYIGMHNTGIVKNGSRPSGKWSPDGGALSQDQYKAFKSAIQEGLSGPPNSGKNIILNGPTKYENLLITSRDMDFVNLMKTSAVDVYNAYRIPLPLVTTETMTLDNYRQAIYMLYDLAVLPKAKFMFKNLGDFILARYKDGNRFRMVLDEREIPALKQRLFERGQSMRNIFAFTEDEIRAEAGYVAREDGKGDTIYIPATYIDSGKGDEEYQVDPFIIAGQKPGTQTDDTPEPDDNIDNINKTNLDKGSAGTNGKPVKAKKGK
jgi:phage portal protein BeeE